MTTEEIEALVDGLKEGVRSCGMHDDGDTELFHIEDANDLMFTAATALQAQLAAAVARAEKAERELARQTHPNDVGVMWLLLVEAGDSLEWCASNGRMRAGDAIQVQSWADHIRSKLSEIARAALPAADKGE